MKVVSLFFVLFFIKTSFGNYYSKDTLFLNKHLMQTISLLEKNAQSYMPSLHEALKHTEQYITILEKKKQRLRYSAASILILHLHNIESAYPFAIQKECLENIKQRIEGLSLPHVLPESFNPHRINVTTKK